MIVPLLSISACIGTVCHHASVYFVAVLHDYKITPVQRDAGRNDPSTPHYSTF